MALRDLVTGGGCSVPGVGPSNPLSNLADSIVGSAAKTQERLRELPLISSSRDASYVDLSHPSFTDAAIPPTVTDSATNQQVSTFLDRFYGNNQQFESAWDQTVQPGPSRYNLATPHQDLTMFQNEGRFSDRLPAHQAVQNVLHAFVDSSRRGIPLSPMSIPELNLTNMEKMRIRDRSSIMARHFHANQDDAYVNHQISTLMQSLRIEDEGSMIGPLGGRFSEFEDYWKRGQAAGSETGLGKIPVGNDWAHEFQGQIQPDQWVREFHVRNEPSQWANEFSNMGSTSSWAQEFQNQARPDQWAEEFEQVWDQKSLNSNLNGRAGIGHVAAQEHTQQLVDTLSKDSNPKFQNSQFLQFVSKMSRGELAIDGNGVKQMEGNDWSREFDQLHHNQNDEWANQFHSGQKSWSDEFVANEGQGNGKNLWSDEFQSFEKDMNENVWANEFHKNMSNGDLDYDEETKDWVDSYDRFVNEQVNVNSNNLNSSKFIYEFSDLNPYVGHPNPLLEGKELFRKGLLSEAILAFEAEVLKNAENSEGWRMLGMTHAENDDDKQAIAAMVRAKDADPTNLEVLLALGVSHTNELEQREAEEYLKSWLLHHPKYSSLLPPNGIQTLSHSELVDLYKRAAESSPEDADVHTVLGVLFNLSRNYTNAVEAFQRSLELRPGDYSLWNKLGATQANSAQSLQAIHAYQQALDIKPNYVRAWTNMGIGYANQGRYEQSIPFYVRALSMNPRAENGWEYLRVSLSCAERTDLLEACDKHDVDAFLKEFPM